MSSLSKTVLLLSTKYCISILKIMLTQCNTVKGLLSRHPLEASFHNWSLLLVELFSCESILYLPTFSEIIISVRFLFWECWDFWRRHDHFWRFPKKSEVFRKSRKSSDDVRSLPKKSEVCRRRRYWENAYLQNQRSRGRYCHLFILHVVFVPYMGLS